MKRICSWRKQLEGTKPVETKDGVNDCETCESEEWLQRPIILIYALNGKPNYIKTIWKPTCIQLQNTCKKAQPYFLQTTRKPEIILIIFITVLTISFLLSSTSSASFEVNNLDKMILLAVKLSRLDVSNTQLKRGFNFPFKFIYGQPVLRSRIWEMYIKIWFRIHFGKGYHLQLHCCLGSLKNRIQ